MKKIKILSVALLALSFASCKKDWTCSCKDATGGEVKTFKKITKRQALSNCQSKTVTEAGSTSNETCTLSKS
jgi:hypothetical protein